ncbi:N-acetylmuramidase domain-containing protein [Roseibium sp.]|uniref:N-acetylmuramidase domain-containing protein n=1 Tax=Roseibium sp. TaxID=1936156 RepID=UPI003D0ECB11
MSDIIAKLREGGGQPANDEALELAARRIGCDVLVLKAIDEVESNGSAYDKKGRLIILPEKHVFWRELPKALRARAKRLGLAVPKWSRGNYKGLGGTGSDARWARLEKMVDLHEVAGLRSASYGSKQIMGFNHGICGYDNVRDFVLAFARSEAAQQEAFIKFLEGVGLAQALRDRDFRQIARRYNGSGQVTRYSGLMRAAYDRLAANNGKAALKPEDAKILRLGSEGDRVRFLQEQLVRLGYHLKADGDFGPATRRQVVAFQVDHGLKPDGIVGDKTNAALEAAVPINSQPGGSRDSLTVKDLRQSGSQTIKQADRLTGLGVGAVVTGTIAEAVGGVGSMADIETLRNFSGLIQEVSGLIKPVLGLIGDNKWLALAAIGAAVFLLARKIKLRRLSDAKEWRHVG